MMPPSGLMQRIDAGEIVARTSFYALHETMMFALQNTPSPEKGRRLGKQALREILQTEVDLLPMLTRAERILHARVFAALKDSSDAPHAISAHLSACQVVVSYDQHFADLPAPLLWRRPEELI